MTIPGFTAEASLASGGQYYRANHGPTGLRSAQRVSPAVLILVDGVEWGWIPGSVYGSGLDLWDGGGGGGGGGGSGCQCLEYELICSPIINCTPGGGCTKIEDCREIC